MGNNIYNHCREETTSGMGGEDAARKYYLNATQNNFSVHEMMKISGLDYPACQALIKKIKAEFNEETTSGDIAYARGELRTQPTPEEEELLKDKSQEDNKEREKGQLGRLKRRTQEVKEDIDRRMPELKKEIIKVIKTTVNSSRLTAEIFAIVFRQATDNTPPTTAVRMLRQKESLLELESKLPNEVGELELIRSALHKGKSLAGFEPFDKMHTLCGATISSAYQGVNVVYMGYKDMNYAEMEKIMVSDIDKAEEAGNHDSSVKVSGKTIYPNGGVFHPAFMNTLRDVLLTDKQPEANKT